MVAIVMSLGKNSIMMPHERFERGMGIPLKSIPHTLEDVAAAISALPTRKPRRLLDPNNEKVVRVQSPGELLDHLKILESYEPKSTERSDFAITEAAREFLLTIIDRAMRTDKGFGALVTLEIVDADKQYSHVDFGFPDDMPSPDDLI